MHYVCRYVVDVKLNHWQPKRQNCFSHWNKWLIIKHVQETVKLITAVFYWNKNTIADKKLGLDERSTILQL